jgi:transcription elongation GreA/GreB family factor
LFGKLVALPPMPCARLRQILNKRALVDGIIAVLGASLEHYEHSARAAHAGATDEQNKPEGKYDTRGLEASYLARGQAQQALDMIQAKQRYETMVLREFGAGEAIEAGAIVELEREGEKTIYFVGAYAGGTEVMCEGREVMVITPVSPLGREMVGKKRGSVVTVGKLKYRVGSVE